MCGATSKPRTLPRNWHEKCSTTRSTKKLHFCNEFMKAKCNENGRPNFNVFAWCRLWSKTTNPLCPSQKCRKMRTLSNKCPKIQFFPKFCHGRVQKCEPFGAFWQGRTQKCEPFCKSSPKVRTVLKFWRTCAQKCEPFRGFGVGCAQKCQLFGNFGKRVPKSANPFKIMAQDVPKSANLVYFFVKNVNPSDNLFECAEQRQNPEPFRRNWHQKCSTTRSTKKLHFCNEFMKAKCNENGRPNFNVFASCRLWSKTANPLYPSQKMQKMRTLCNPSPECAELCENLEPFRSFAQKSEPFVAPRCASPPVTSRSNLDPSRSDLDPSRVQGPRQPACLPACR